MTVEQQQRVKEIRAHVANSWIHFADMNFLLDLLREEPQDFPPRVDEISESDRQALAESMRFAPAPKEASLCFWVASYAEDVCKSFLETGRPDADSFMCLCAALSELEGETIGAVPFHERAEDLHEFWLSQKARAASEPQA